jgi:hypothetical protein
MVAHKGLEAHGKRTFDGANRLVVELGLWNAWRTPSVFKIAGSLREVEDG